MKLLSIVGDTDPNSIFFPQIPVHTARVRLKCPACHDESVHRHLPFDARLACAVCGAESEFREWHEAWCASRREALIRAFPDLQWLKTGYAEFVPPGGRRHEHLRTTP